MILSYYICYIIIHSSWHLMFTVTFSKKVLCLSCKLNFIIELIEENGPKCWVASSIAANNKIGIIGRSSLRDYKMASSFQIMEVNSYKYKKDLLHSFVYISSVKRFLCNLPYFEQNGMQDVVDIEKYKLCIELVQGPIGSFFNSPTNPEAVHIGG